MCQITLPELYPELFQNKEKPSMSREQIAETKKIEKRHTKQSATSSKISNEMISKIKEEVNKKKTKIQVANELGVSYDFVKKHTKDITTIHKTPVELVQRIREEVKKGKKKCLVAKELGISKCTVWKYTRDIIRCRKIPPEVIEQIRRNVRKYKSKLETARKLGIPYRTVRYLTEDIQLRTRLTTEMIEEIRSRVKNGKMKTQVAKELNISICTVSRHTMDIYQVKKRANIGIKAFSLLQEILDKGYAFSCSRYGLEEYQILKKKFPKVCRAKMYNRQIFYLDGQSDIAMRAFLEKLNMKIISYQKLQQIIKLFQGKMGKKDKKKYLGKTN